MTSIKRDDSKQKWEETEFPLVCETCLGDNPYVRMTKEPHGKKCRVCDIPFTVFAWQAGTRGRLKKVEICRSCARSKNVCQVCIYDLQYGLPVQVRDQVLAEEGCKDSVVAVPQSDANRAWMTAQQERDIEQGKAIAGCVPTNAAAAARLQGMGRSIERIVQYPGYLWADLGVLHTMEEERRPGHSRPSGDLGFPGGWSFRCCCVGSALHSRLSPPNFVARPRDPSKRRNKFDLEQHEHLPPSSNNSSAPNFVPGASIFEIRRCRLASRTRLAEISSRANFQQDRSTFANGPSHALCRGLCA